MPGDGPFAGGATRNRDLISKLPSELLLHISYHMNDERKPQSLAVLARTCRALSTFVQLHGWKSWLDANERPRIIDRDLPAAGRGRNTTSLRGQVHRQLLIDASWQEHRIIGHQSSFDVRGKEDATEPFLELGSEWLLLFIRSEVRVWHASYLQRNVRWTSKSQAPKGVQMEDAQVVRLPIFANKEQQHRHLFRAAVSKADRRSEMLKHVSASCLLEPMGTSFLVGRVDGTIAHFRLPDGLSTRDSVKVSQREQAPWQQFAPRKLNFEAEIIAELPLPDNATAKGSIQDLSYSYGYLCAVKRSGTVLLYKQRKSDGSAWELLWQFQMGRQVWCCHLDQNPLKKRSLPRFLAIGSKGTEALFLFQLKYCDGNQGIVPSTPIVLNSIYTEGGEQAQLFEALKGCTGRPNSVFTIVQPSSKCSAPLHSDQLAAGFYDGVVRMYDLRPALSAATQHPLWSGESPQHPLYPSDSSFRPSDEQPEHQLTTYLTLSPCMHFRDRFDASAIYSLSVGGGNGTHIMAGTATSGNIKIFDARQAANVFETLGQRPTIEVDRLLTNSNHRISTTLPPGSGSGWSVFAGYPARSPTFSLVSDFDFIIAATDKKLVDLVFTSVARPRSDSPDMDRRKARPIGKDSHNDRVAFYKLDTMLLEHAEP